MEILSLRDVLELDLWDLLLVEDRANHEGRQLDRDDAYLCLKMLSVSQGRSGCGLRSMRISVVPMVLRASMQLVVQMTPDITLINKKVLWSGRTRQ